MVKLLKNFNFKSMSATDAANVDAKPRENVTRSEMLALFPNELRSSQEPDLH